MECFIGEIKMFAGSFAPENFVFCAGQSMPISSNQELYSLLGTTYGGDGVNDFNLPDLRSRVAVGQGQNPPMQAYKMGQSGGTEQVTITPVTMPAHNHTFNASNEPGTTNVPGYAVCLATLPEGSNAYVPKSTTTPANVVEKPLYPDTIGIDGGSNAHNNIMPTTGINYIICIAAGLFPSQA